MYMSPVRWEPSAYNSVWRGQQPKQDAKASKYSTRIPHTLIQLTSKDLKCVCRNKEFTPAGYAQTCFHAARCDHDAAARGLEDMHVGCLGRREDEVFGWCECLNVHGLGLTRSFRVELFGLLLSASEHGNTTA